MRMMIHSYRTGGSLREATETEITRYCDHLAWVSECPDVGVVSPRDVGITDIAEPIYMLEI